MGHQEGNFYNVVRFGNTPGPTFCQIHYQWCPVWVQDWLPTRQGMPAHSNQQLPIYTIANYNVVDEHIVEELRAGRLIGPMPPQFAWFVYCSPMGLVPKSHQIDK